MQEPFFYKIFTKIDSTLNCLIKYFADFCNARFLKMACYTRLWSDLMDCSSCIEDLSPYS